MLVVIVMVEISSLQLGSYLGLYRERIIGKVVRIFGSKCGTQDSLGSTDLSGTI